VPIRGGFNRAEGGKGSFISRREGVLEEFSRIAIEGRDWPVKRTMFVFVKHKGDYDIYFLLLSLRDFGLERNL